MQYVYSSPPRELYADLVFCASVASRSFESKTCKRLLNSLLRPFHISQVKTISAPQAHVSLGDRSQVSLPIRKEDLSAEGLLVFVER